MADVYVRPTGGTYGAEDGSSYADAWDGLTNIGALSAGDTLYICGDFTGENKTFTDVGTSEGPIVIRGDYSGDPGVLDGDGNSVSIIRINGDYVTVRDLTLHNADRGVDCRGSYQSVLNCTVYDCVNQGLFWAISAGTASDWTAQGNTVYDCGRNTGGGNIYVTCGAGLSLGTFDISANTTYCSDRTHATIGRHGITVYPTSSGTVDGGNIYNNTVYDCPLHGVSLVNDTQNVHVYNNTVYTCLAAGIKAGGASDGTAQNNEIYGNTVYGILITGVDGVGVFFDSFSGSSKAYSNTIYSCEEAAIKCSVSDSNFIYGNLCHSTVENGIEIRGDSDDNTVANNTVLHEGTGYALQLSTPAGSNTDNVVVNNIFYDIRVGSAVSNLVETGTGRDVSYNDFYKEGTGDVITVDGTDYTVAEVDAAEADFSSNVAVSVAPELGEDYAPGAAVLQGSGSRWWAGANPVGHDGEPIADWSPSVGAVQSREVPFHPANL